MKRKALSVLILCGFLATAAAAQEAAVAEPETDPELERVTEMLESARKEIREFKEAGGEDDDPEHPGRRWVEELWGFRREHPGTAAADSATTEAIHFMLHQGQAEEAVERALALPEDDGAWPRLVNILFEAAELLDDYSFFTRKAEALGSLEFDPEKWAALRFQVVQAHWVEGDFEKARAALREIAAEEPSPEWMAQVAAAREELGHPEIRDGDRSWRHVRDLWQRPGRVMEALAIGRGDRVADVGSGTGYFSFILARRVGEDGRVFAVEIDEKLLEKLAARAAELELGQIETVLGATDDPRLPEGELDAILVVDTYHEMRDYEEMMAGMRRALAPGGRLGIVDIPGELGRPREEYHDRHRIPVEVVIEEAAAAGLRLHSFDRDFAHQPNGRGLYLVVFTRPAEEE